jgi:DNA-binding beta-propeller fold protein YncE
MFTYKKTEPFGAMFLALSVLSVATCSHSQQMVEPLKLVQTIPMPGLKDGDFDHFSADYVDHLLFLAAEENGAVEVFDLNTNKLIHTITGLDAPHSMVYRRGLKKLFVVDGDANEIRIFQGPSFKPAGTIKGLPACDSMAYDPSTKYMYVINGGSDAGLSYSFVSVVDTTSEKKLADIKLDADEVEAVALETKGPLMYVNLRSKDAVAVVNRETRSVVATWSIATEGKTNVPMAFDEPDHRLFVATEDPGKVIFLDSETGKIRNTMPCGSSTDDAYWDPTLRRLYVAGVPNISVYQLIGPNRFRILGQVPSAWHGVTGILIPQLNRYYVAVSHHGQTRAQVFVYEVVP